MKSFILSVVLSLGFPLACQGIVIPRDDPIKPNRPISATGATRVNARFGPFKLPSNAITGPKGMTGLNIDTMTNLPMPCKGCTYTYIRGDMVYKDGTSANNKNGAYMHHMTLHSLPSGNSSLENLLKEAITGAGNKPSEGSRGSAIPGSKPVYLIGNERLPLTFPKAGVYLAKNASVTLGVQLQNMETDPKEVYIDMEYEYLPGQPEGYTDIIPVPQDALGMRGGTMGSLKQSGVWDRTSGQYIVGQDARILMMYGHLHDGGIHTEIMVNGKLICDSIAYYQDMKIPANQTTTSPEQMGHSHMKRDGGNSHIMAFGECVELGAVKKGDVMTTKVFYDFDRRPSTPMPNGQLDELMGISMTYLGIPMKQE